MVIKGNCWDGTIWCLQFSIFYNFFNDLWLEYYLYLLTHSVSSSYDFKWKTIKHILIHEKVTISGKRSRWPTYICTWGGFGTGIFLFFNFRKMRLLKILPDFFSITGSLFLLYCVCSGSNYVFKLSSFKSTFLFKFFWWFDEKWLMKILLMETMRTKKTT